MDKNIGLKEEVLSKICRFTAYQERSCKETMDRLKKIGVENEDARDLYLDYLIEERYVDNERFVNHYIKGKVKLKKWGINKIKQGLYPHHIEPNILQKALKQIDKKLYIENLSYLMDKKASQLTGETNLQVKKGKLVQFLVSKGYTLEEIFNLL